VISAEIDPGSANGVIVAQGGGAQGYSLYIHDRKLSFAIRTAKKLTIITATEPLPNGPSKVQAQLSQDGHITLSVNDQPVGTGQAPGLLAAQPVRGFSVGADNGPVSDYAAPNTFAGKIEKVTVRSL
jgi:hypothetical protein